MRVLLASSRDWTGVARLPSVLAAAGFTVDLLDRGGTQAASSRWLSASMTERGAVGEFANRFCAMAPGYDRVIACDEPLLSALAATATDVAAPFLPAHHGFLADLLDKTRFPAVAALSGLRVPRSLVVGSPDAVPDAFAKMAGPVIVKGRHGYGGLAVRRAATLPATAAAADRLGFPVLLEECLDGVVELMPCLFEHGALVAAFAAQKVRTSHPLGPSTVNRLRPVSDALRRTAESAGRILGLHGFVSFDFFDPGDGGDGEAPLIIEINLRPVPQLHLGAAAGVDMALALRDVMAGDFDGRPRTGRGDRTVMLFPQELRRLRSKHGRIRGTVRWMATPGASEDVPWHDAPLVWRHLMGRS